MTEKIKSKWVVPLGCKIDKILDDKLKKRQRETGITIRRQVEMALEQYFDAQVRPGQ